MVNNKELKKKKIRRDRRKGKPKQQQNEKKKYVKGKFGNDNQQRQMYANTGVRTYAQQQVPRIAKQKALSLGSTYNNMSPDKKKLLLSYIKNFLWPTKVWNFPCIVPSYKVPKWYQMQFTFDSVANYETIIVRNDLNALISRKILSGTNLTPVVPIEQIIELNGNQNLTPNSNYCFDQSITTTSGTNVLSVGNDFAQPNPNTYYHTSTSTRSVVLGVKGYRNVKIAIGASVTMSVSNLGGYTVTGNFHLVSLTQAGVATIIQSATAGTINANATKVYTITAAADIEILPPDALMFVFENTGVVNVVMNNTNFIVSGVFSFITPEVWENRSLATLISGAFVNDNSGAGLVWKQMQDMLLASSFVKVTALAALWNVTQELKDAGGQFLCGYMPGYTYSALPSTDPERWEYILANPYPSYNGKFVDGVHGSWIGQRFEDYSWKKFLTNPELEAANDNMSPFLIFMANKIALETRVTYRLDLRVSFDMQTIDRTQTCVPPMAAAGLLEAIVAMAAISKPVGANKTEHLQTVMKIAKNIAGNPMVQDAFSALLKSGVAALLI